MAPGWLRVEIAPIVAAPTVHRTVSGTASVFGSPPGVTMIDAAVTVR